MKARPEKFSLLDKKQKKAKQEKTGIDPKFKKHLENVGYVWFNIFDLFSEPIILKPNQFYMVISDLIEFLLQGTLEKDKPLTKEGTYAISGDDIQVIKRKNLA